MKIWRRIISDISDGQLVDMVIAINRNRSPRRKIAVSGFDNLSRAKNDPNQLRIVRRRLDREIYKPQNLVDIQRLLLRHIKVDEEQAALIEAKEAEEIYQMIREEQLALSWGEVLIWMLSHAEEQIRSKAEAFFQILEENGELEASKEEPAEAERASEKSTAGEEPQANERIQELEGQLEDLAQEKARLANEVRSLTKKVTKLESELNEMRKTNEKNVRELENRREEISSRDKKIGQMIEQLAEYEQANQEQSLKLSSLVSEVERLKNENEQYQKEINELTNKINDRKIKAVFIDPQRNEMNMLSDKRFSITWISPNDLDNEVILEQADQIWFTSFRLPALKKASLRERYGKKIIEFENYNKLRDYCNGTVETT